MGVGGERRKKVRGEAGGKRGWWGGRGERRGRRQEEVVGEGERQEARVGGGGIGEGHKVRLQHAKQPRYSG